MSTWFHDETNRTISVTMQVADLSGVDAWDDPRLGFIRWGTRFQLTNYLPTSGDYWENTWIMGIDLNNGPTGWHASLSPPSRHGELTPQLPAAHTIDRANGSLTVTVDRADLGNPMAGDAMTQTLSLHDGSWGAGIYGIDYRDQAPDGTYPSHDFVFQLDTGSNATVEELPTEPLEQRAPISTAVLLVGIFLAARRGRGPRVSQFGPLFKRRH